MFKTLFYILIFPGLLFSTCFGLFLSGIDRKIVARIQRRKGPSIIQPFYDFIKLLSKENIIPGDASKKVFLIAPFIGFISIVTIPLFIPMFNYSFFPFTADVIVIIYLLTIGALALIIGGAASGSPYAGIGISREMVTMIAYELPLIIVLLTVGAKVGLQDGGAVTFSLSKIANYQAKSGALITKWSVIPAALAFLLIIPAEVGTCPFDVAEAETEICEGPLVEYSGLYLGMYKLTQSVKIFIMSYLFVSLFLGGKGSGNIILDILIVLILIILVMVVSISFIRSIVGRIKVEQLLKFFWTVPTLLSLFSLILVYLKL